LAAPIRAPLFYRGRPPAFLPIAVARPVADICGDGRAHERFAGVEEIANMVVFVASKEVCAANSAVLRAEGGIVNTIA